jgi:NADPH:quinone reductase-like Zn-dependent oxidoreductase
MRGSTNYATRWILCIFCSAFALGTTGPAEAQSPTTRQWQFGARPGGQGCQLTLIELPARRPSAGEIQVRIRATSLNGHDPGPLRRTCGPAGPEGQVALADGAGEVTAVGPGVSRFQVGDRVVGAFFAESFIDGRRLPEAMQHIRGGPGPGMLSEVVVGSEHGFVRVPDHLSYEEAATLPTAAVTAYVSLFKYGGLLPNDYVLLEGTGGVSSFGLLFSLAAGAKPIITSSSDEKLARARQLGAVGTVNYRTNAEWQDEVLAITGGAGVQHVIEVVGAETRDRALEALAVGGHMALVGSLSGAAGPLPTRGLSSRDIRISSFFVGSRADFEEMNEFMTGHQIRPIIDRVFDFEEAEQAFEFIENGDFMGKVVIRL